MIGLGSMGFGMATSLLRAGFDVTGCDVSADAVARFVAEGGGGARTPAEAAGGADIVVSVVVNAAQTETILFGEDGVAETLAKDAVFISSATMDPDVARRLAKQLEATGRHYLDAPISGGAQRAAEGELTILASGSAAAFAKARPALDAMAAKLYELGDAAGPGRRVQDDQPASRRRAHRRRLRGDRLRGQAGPRYPQGLRGDHGVRRQFLDVREPHAACARRRLHAAQRGGDFRQGPRHRPGHGASAKFPVPVVAAALQMFLMRRAPAWAATTMRRSRGCMPASPARRCRASRQVTRTIEEDSQMPRFAANLTMMFNEWPFLDRFDAAAQAGFTAVEYLFPYEHPPEAIAERLDAQRPDAGAVQPAAGRLGGRRTRHCGAARTLRRSASRACDTALPYARRPASSGCT